ncbi:MAG TPA: hypothetical protein VF255_04565 [Solirubrobacterales bacterium]
MTRKLKALGPLIVVLIGVTAFAPSASAANFHSEVAHTQISGEGSPFFSGFSFNAGKVSCGTETFSGTQAAATTSELNLTPSFPGYCTAFGFISTVVDVNGCSFKLTPSSHPDLHIVCPGNPITITGFNCHVTIGSQTVNTGVTYVNNGVGATREITASLNLTGLTYTQSSKSFPGCTNGTFNNGTYQNPIRLKGATTIGTQVGIWWS